MKFSLQAIIDFFVNIFKRNHIPPKVEFLDQSNNGSIPATVDMGISSSFNFLKAKNKPTYCFLIGINKYRNSNGNDLNGCVEDVTAVRDFLVKEVGVPLNATKILSDYEATSGNVRGEFARILSSVKAGDNILIYHSGHGSTIPNTSVSGDTESEDQVWCMTNFFSGGMIVDDEVFKFCKEIEAKGATITIANDCCHSGSNFRQVLTHASFDASMTKRKSIEYSSLDEFEKNSVQLSMARYRASNVVTDNATYKFKNVVHLAACGDLEVASELILDGKVRGIFTFALLQALRNQNSTKTLQSLRVEVQSIISKKMGAGHQNIVIDTSGNNDKSNIFFLK